MNEVRVRLFARARDLAGSDAVVVALPDGATVAELRRRLAAQHPALAELMGRSALAMDQEFVGDAVVVTGKEIALLPPVSGG